MPKLKTSKSASKRFKISSKGKMMRRRVNAGHFNAKSTGGERGHKRGSENTNASNDKDLANLFPYSI